MTVVPYVYTIRHKHTDKLYIGSRTISKSIDILDRYTTSSRVVNMLIENDPTSFEIIDIVRCDSPEQAVELENYFLRNVPKSDRHRYLNVNFSAGGAVIKAQTHIRITKEVVDFNAYDLKYISDSDISFNPALGSGQLQVRDIHYVTRTKRSTWDFCQLLDKKCIASKKGFDGWYDYALQHEWIKE